MLSFRGKKQLEEIVNNSMQEELVLNANMGSFLFYGDNQQILSKLLNSFAGKVDLVYIDPPFNTNQVFAISEGRASTISRVKQGIVAYSDLMTKEDFLSFMYERFVLIRELLSEKGSLYVHIDTKMGHYFKVMLDEIFGDENFKNDITRIKSNPKNFDRKAYGNQKDVVLFYSKNAKCNIWNDVRITLEDDEEIAKKFPKIDIDGRRYTTIPLHAPGETKGATGSVWRGMNPPAGRHWRTNPLEFDRMDAEGLIEWSSTGNPRIKKFADEHRGIKIQDIWKFKDPQYPVYPTEKNLEMLELIIKQSSNIDSLVLDCFAGSGTTLLAAAKNGRRFIGIDNSPVAIESIKEKLQKYEYSYIDLTQ